MNRDSLISIVKKLLKNQMGSRSVTNNIYEYDWMLQCQGINSGGFLLS